AADDECIVANPRHVATILVANVGAEEGIVRVTHTGAKRVLPPIELVVAECTRGVADLVEDAGDRTTECEVGGERPLELVASFHEQDFALRTHALGLRTPDRGGQIGRTTATDTSGIDPRFERTVKVVRPQD